MSRIKKINFVFLMTFLTAILGGEVVSLIGEILNIDISKNYFLYLMAYQGIIIIPAICYMIYNKLSIKEVIRFNKIKGSNIVLIVLFAYLISPVMSLLNQISMLFANNYINDTVREALDGEPLFMGLLFIAFVPCILEEGVYRGVFFNEYRKADTLKGILLSGFLFGLMHLNINQFVYAATLGMIFALLIEATDSILSSMICHFVINGTSVMLVYALPRLIEKLTSIYPEYGNQLSQEYLDVSVNSISKSDIVAALPFEIVVAVISGFLAFLVLKNIAKNSGRWEHIVGIFSRNKNKESDVKRSHTTWRMIMTPSLIAGIVACILYMVVTEWLIKYL